MDNIEVLLERIESLQIMYKALEETYCYNLRFSGLDKRTTLVLEKHKRTQ